MVNYIYSHYNGIKFDMSEGGKSLLQSQSMKSKRLILEEMNDIISANLRGEKFERITLFLNYFVDFYNLRPFVAKNEVISLVILYQLILIADINAFKYVSFFEMLYFDFPTFTDQLCNASVNWTSR